MRVWSGSSARDRTRCQTIRCANIVEPKQKHNPKSWGYGSNGVPQRLMVVEISDFTNDGERPFPRSPLFDPQLLSQRLPFPIDQRPGLSVHHNFIRPRT